MLYNSRNKYGPLNLHIDLDRKCEPDVSTVCNSSSCHMCKWGNMKWPYFSKSYSKYFILLIEDILNAHVMWVPLMTLWHVLGLKMEEIGSRYGG